MSERFDICRFSRSTVTVRFTTSQTAHRVETDVQNGGLAIDSNSIEDVTIREVVTSKMTPESYRLRQAAIRAARESRQLVTEVPDPRD